MEDTAGAPAREGSHRLGLALAVLLALAACLPYLVATYPQLTDYPSHLARYHVMLDAGKSAYLSRYYDFQWMWNGNLGADLLIGPLARLLGLERAGWLIGAVIPPLTGLGLVAVEWVLRRRIGVGAMLAMATIWSPAMGMGFYNFCLSLALALFGFAGWVALDGRRWRWLVALPFGFATWLCHVSGWGVLGVLVFGYEWSRRKNASALLAPWPLMPPFLVLLFAEKAAGALNYGDRLLAYKKGIWLMALRDQSMQLDLFTLFALLVAMALAAWKRRIDGRLGWAAAILLVLTLVMPRHLGGGDYADYRLIAVALMVGSLAIALPRPPRWLLVGAASLFVVRLVVTAEAWHRQSRELELALGALDRVPQGARIAGAVGVDAYAWRLNPFEHAPSWATVRRDALVNSHFAVKGVHMLTLKQGGRGFVDPSQRIFTRFDSPVDLAAFAPARQADYLWYFGEAPVAKLPPGARVLHRTRNSLMLRLAKAVDGG